MSHRQEEINREAWRIQCEEEARQRKANGPEAQPPPEKPSRESAHSNVTAVALDEFLKSRHPAARDHACAVASTVRAGNDPCTARSRKNASSHRHHLGYGERRRLPAMDMREGVAGSVSRRRNAGG